MAANLQLGRTLDMTEKISKMPKVDKAGMPGGPEGQQDEPGNIAQGAKVRNNIDCGLLNIKHSTSAFE